MSTDVGVQVPSRAQICGLRARSRLLRVRVHSHTQESPLYDRDLRKQVSPVAAVPRFGDDRCSSKLACRLDFRARVALAHQRVSSARVDTQIRQHKRLTCANMIHRVAAVPLLIIYAEAQMHEVAAATARSRTSHHLYPHSSHEARRPRRCESPTSRSGRRVRRTPEVIRPISDESACGRDAAEPVDNDVQGLEEVLDLISGEPFEKCRGHLATLCS